MFGFNIQKHIEKTKKTFWRRTQICEENNLCQILFQINSQYSSPLVYEEISYFTGILCLASWLKMLGRTYEYCKIFKNTFFEKQLRVAASVHCL